MLYRTVISIAHLSSGQQEREYGPRVYEAIIYIRTELPGREMRILHDMYSREQVTELARNFICDFGGNEMLASKLTVLEKEGVGGWRVRIEEPYND